jgi:hypothetical protein
MVERPALELKIEVPTLYRAAHPKVFVAARNE